MAQTCLNLTDTLCKVVGGKWNSDVCMAISALWRRTFGICVDDLYEVLKVIYGDNPKAFVDPSRIRVGEIDILKEYLRKYAEYTKSKSDEIQRFVETIERVVFSTASKNYTFGSRTLITIRPPHSIQIDNVSCEKYLPFYAGENVKPPSILPSWIKGYLREVLHKLIFVKLLRLCLDKSLLDRCLLYISLVANDEKGPIIKSESKSVSGVLNLVGVLLGSGSLASSLRIVQLEEPQQGVYSRLRYELTVDTAAATLSKTLVKTILPGAKNDIDKLIFNLDIVAAHIIKSSMLIRAPQPCYERFNFTVFVPFAPGFRNILFDDRALMCYSEFAEGVEIELRHADSEVLQSSLKALNKILEEYASYLFNALPEAFPTHLQLFQLLLKPGTEGSGQ